MLLSDAIKLLTSYRPPTDHAKLIDKCILHHGGVVDQEKLRLVFYGNFWNIAFKKKISFQVSYLKLIGKNILVKNLRIGKVIAKMQ